MREPHVRNSGGAPRGIRGNKPRQGMSVAMQHARMEFGGLRQAGEINLPGPVGRGGARPAAGFERARAADC